MVGNQHIRNIEKDKTQNHPETTRILAEMERKEKWAICYKGKIIPIGDETIKWIRQDPTKIWEWFEMDLMIAWKDLFPLTETSKRLGWLPMKDEA